MGTLVLMVSKVCHLLNGIKTNSLDHVKIQIQASADLHRNFDDSVTLFKDFSKTSNAS